MVFREELLHCLMSKTKMRTASMHECYLLMVCYLTMVSKMKTVSSMHELHFLMEFRFYIWLGVLVFPISVKIEHEGISGRNSRLDLHSCNSIVRLQTNESLKDLFVGENKNQKLSLNIALKRKSSEKGCAQDTYNPIGFYNECGVDNVSPLLPTHNALPDSFAKHVARKTSEKGGLDYIFDGGTAVRFPPDKLPPYWYQEYTICGWIRPEVHPDRQYIISWSDGDTPRHQNTGFFVTRKSGVEYMMFGFHHIHKDVSFSQECVVKEKWKVRVDDETRWHFFTLSFKECNVELTVNGQYLSPTGVGFTFGMPGKHIQPKFVIGARWAFGVTKYKEYFRGVISGLMLRYGSALTYDSLNCLLKCREKLRLSTNLPSGLQEEGLQNGGQLIIEGEAGRETFENLINDIIYINENEFPEKDTRTISVTTLNKDTNVAIKNEINIDVKRQHSTLAIQNDCGKQEDAKLFFNQGMKLCPDLKLVLAGCLQFIDLLTVTVRPELSKKEKVFVPQEYLTRHKVVLFSTDNGFVLHGVASVVQYMDILSQIRYAYQGVGDISRTIMITVSSQNGLVQSNDFVVTLKTSKDKVYVSPNSRHIKSSNFIDLVRVEEGPQPIKYQQHYKKIAMASNRSTQGYIGWMALACAFSVIGVLFMVGYGVRKRNRTNCTIQYNLHEHHTLAGGQHSYSLSEQPSLVSLPKSSDCVSPDFYWDDQGLSMRLIINPSERISIINDPYSELLSKERRRDEAAISCIDTEGSVYSDDDLSDFDTDSIRQLEWDWLENNLEEVLEEDRLMTEIREGKRKKEDLYNEVFL